MEERDGLVAVLFSWAEKDGTRHEWAQLLKLRDGLIVDLQDYARGEKAIRALRGRRL